jgi:excisionase family DNA binding protein
MEKIAQKDQETWWTTKDVAKFLGVSTASVKRWSQKDLLPVRKTAGGHRRFSFQDVLAFSQESETGVVETESVTRQKLWAWLLHHDEQAFRTGVRTLFESGKPLAGIFDECLAPLFHDIGCAWEEGRLDVYEERQCVELGYRVLAEWLGRLPSPQVSAPLAIGGTFEDNHYQLANLMVELVLREQGFRCLPMGVGLPQESMIQALTHYQPDLFWLSVTHVSDEAQFLAASNALFDACKAHQCHYVVGGQGLSSDLRSKMAFTVYCGQLTHLCHYVTQVFGVSS